MDRIVVGQIGGFRPAGQLDFPVQFETCFAQLSGNFQFFFDVLEQMSQPHDYRWADFLCLSFRIVCGTTKIYIEGSLSISGKRR